MAIIAVFSTIHSGGGEVSRKVASRLGYNLVGEELLKEAAQTYGTSLEKLVRALGKPVFFNPVTREWERSTLYIKAALADRLKGDDLVYYGPATHLIPSGIRNVLKVGIVADMDFRIGRAQEQSEFGQEEAEKKIEKYDADVSTWIEQLYGRSLFDASLYDITIPIPETSIEEAVALVVENAQKDAVKTGNGSKKTVQDFIQATRVNLSLLSAGYYYCDVEVVGERVEVTINKRPTIPGSFPRSNQTLRYDIAEKNIRELCLGFEGVSEVETYRGLGFGIHALLVDDEEDYVLTLSMRLETRDISTRVVHSGEQALDALGVEEPDVMVLDLQMPGIDGIEVLRRVKREHPKVEVIILTGHGSEKDEQTTEQLGAFAFLKKPVDVEVLVKTMKESFEKARGED